METGPKVFLGCVGFMGVCSIGLLVLAMIGRSNQPNSLGGRQSAHEQSGGVDPQQWGAINTRLLRLSGYSNLPAFTYDHATDDHGTLSINVTMVGGGSGARVVGEKVLIEMREATLGQYQCYWVAVNGPPPGTGLISRYGRASMCEGGKLDWKYGF